MDTQLQSDLNTLRSLRVYFGHQSVGRNILDAVERLSASSEAPLRVVDVAAASPEGAWFAESAIGRNGDPGSKCTAFRSEIEKLRGRVDIALMKFCYIDFDEHSRIDEIFWKYSNTMQELRQRYPGVIFVHSTVPLKSSASGIKRAVKNILGRADQSRPANLKRSEFNDLLRRRYRNDPVFDLARIECTDEHGRREEFFLNGKTGYSLLCRYTSDCGHLNELGSSVAARELIRILAAAARSRTAGTYGKVQALNPL